MKKGRLNLILDMAQTAAEKRIAAELNYAYEHCEHISPRYAGDVGQCIEFVLQRMRSGDFSGEDLAAAERMLGKVGKEIKKTEVLCVAHAHMDMNWTWGFDETVSIVLSTLQTMLDLLDEYPGFRYSLSQAAAYRIVETYAPAMLEKIRAHIRAGRWEVSASTWVENDKNMPCAESQIRQITEAKSYLSRLLDIDPDTLNLDFEPDTFGHCSNIPEILTDCGVRYYYHCRGNVETGIYRWRAKSGAELLVYCDPMWYNLEIDPSHMAFIPAFNAKYGLNKFLKIYGVGNHGGGVTRRDLNLLLDMQTWPAMPAFRFSTYAEFFAYLEENRQKFPVREGENNFVFTGCYSSQQRIKSANRFAENALLRAENLAAFSAQAGFRAYDAQLMRNAWRDTLFLHFHDIVTGSGVEETRQYACAKAQEVGAAAGAVSTAALTYLASRIDIPDGAAPVSNTFAEGAGAGFCSGNGVFAANVGAGDKRYFLLLNESGVSKEFVVPVTLWDFDGKYIRAETCAGAPLACSVLEKEAQPYWGHYYRTVCVRIFLKAYGYETIVLRLDEDAERPLGIDTAERQNEENDYILENDLVRLRFDASNAAIVSFYDKKNGRELLAAGKSAHFRLIEEDDGRRKTAWVEGNRKRVKNFDDCVRIVDARCKKDGLLQTIAFEAEFGSSRLTAEFSLDACSDMPVCDVVCDFLEIGKNTCVPRLEFSLPPAEDFRAFYDVPFGIEERDPSPCDRPASTFQYGRLADGCGMALVTDCCHGFRSDGKEMSVTLLRASSDPDPYPELGRHTFRIGLMPYRFRSQKELTEKVRTFTKRVSVLSLRPAKGELPCSGELFSHEGESVISCIKPAEEEGALLLRFYDANGKGGEDRFTFLAGVERAFLCSADGNEKEAIAAEGRSVVVRTKKYSVNTIKVYYKTCRQ